MDKIIIAIDGYSACGKSTTAKAVAHFLGYTYIDTGAMYRAVTLYFMNHYVNLTNPKQVQKALSQINLEFEQSSSHIGREIYLNGINVSKKIREMSVTERVSEVSALSSVREELVRQQIRMGKKKGVVMDGRDIGTVVFPDAELKVFMTAELRTRAARRQKELLDNDQLINLDVIIDNLKKRDHLDTTREVSPLKKAPDAFLLDTTHLTFSEQVEMVLNLATSAIVNKHYTSKSVII